MRTRPRTLFITGTDTGVGKTLLTALLLCHLRRTGHQALALKPFCSGGRADARLLRSLQGGAFKNQKSRIGNAPTLDDVNPFCYPAPVAPLVAARLARRPVKMQCVLDHIQDFSSRHFSIDNQKPKSKNPFLLIEGAGGLLVPLGENYSVLDLIAALSCEVIIVARNRLGTLNHTLLTVRALQRAGVQNLRVALMDCIKPDLSARANPSLLAEFLAPIPVVTIPFLPGSDRSPARLSATAGHLRRRLAHLI